MLGQRRDTSGYGRGPKSTHIPKTFHRINVLTRILSPCIAWRCLRVERAMGIEPIRKVVPDLESKQFGAIMNAMCDGRVNLGGTWGNVGLLDKA
jgi:hypothetical protein